jgi:hypothetical protein
MENDLFFGHFTSQIGDSERKISSKAVDKIKNLLKIMSAPKIVKTQLESQCFLGIPDDCNGLRALCWKILLNYLPEQHSKWASSLELNRKNYQNYLNEFFLPRLKMSIQQKKNEQLKKSQ